MINRTRNKRIEIYFNDEEIEKLDKDCKSLGLSRSEYIRELITSKIIDRKNNQDIINSIFEIKKTENILDKINSKLDSKEYYALSVYLNKTLKEINDVLIKLKNKLDQEVLNGDYFIMANLDDN